ncbi:MAG: type II toxin-antitoxin system Phd/YefM family antitoxin [Nitrospirota bacterium]
MTIKFSEDIISLSDLKVNPGKVVSHVNETHRPILLTSRGRGVAVVQSLKDYEEETEQRAFMQGVVKGLMDLEEGREISLSEAKKRLGLK